MVIKLNITRFGGRGASSSNAKSRAIANIGTGKYSNDNVNDFGDWWQDNVDMLADNFEEKYNKPPVNPNTGMTNSKWDAFTESEWKKEKKAVEGAKTSTKLSSGSTKVTFSKVSVGDTFKYKNDSGITYNFEVTKKTKGGYSVTATSRTKDGKTTKLSGSIYTIPMHNGTQKSGVDFNKITNYKKKRK